MNFELAKKLKESGFPYLNYKKSGYAYRGEGESSEWVEKPILSELIDECMENEKYFCLTQESGDGDGVSKKISFWRASIIVKNNHVEENTNQWINESIEKIGEGKTPEEAVANLWLALKDKKQ